MISEGVIQIAVTGHRFIDDSNHELTASINNRVRPNYLGSSRSDYHLLSALAEGSDQFVARIARQVLLIKLIVPLPLPQETYLLDFETVKVEINIDSITNNRRSGVSLTENSEHDFCL